MSKYEARNKARDASKKLFGQEDTITVGVQDPRYRFYQWLRSWFGMGERLVTHKCPFYQFMFWGSLLLVATFPLFIFAYIIYGVTKVLGVWWPDIPEGFAELKDGNPFTFSLVISLMSATIILFISLLFLDNAVAWVGYVIYCIFAAPVIILWLLWELLSWLAVDVLASFFVWVWGLLVSMPWALVGYVFGMGLLILLGIAVTFWVFYRIAVFLFNRGCFNFLIKKSCNVRENRRDRKAERLEVLRKAELAAQKERDEYYKKHKKEIDAKNAKRRETFEKWTKTIGMIFSPVSWFVGGFFSILVAVIMAIWWFIKKVGEIIYVVWHMVTSTVSNHCPPIEFIELHEDVGELVPNRHNGGYLDGEERRLHIDPDKFPEKFKLRTKQEDYKKVRISYNLVASHIVDYDNRYHVHSITAIKYLPKSRVKKAKTDGK